MDKRSVPKRHLFVRTTITIPQELKPFVARRKSDPQHSGNLSSYIRSLIIADKKSIELEEKAA
jgi:hypothetical protein